MTDGSCGEGWVEPPDFDDWCCRESGYFTPNTSSDSDVEEDLSYGDGRRARTSMLTPPLSPKSPSTTPPPFSLYQEVLGKRPRSINHADKTEVTIDAIETDFTPRCTMQHGIQNQKDAVQAAVTISDKQWDAYANMLSPPQPCKYHKPPGTCPNPPLVRPTCRFSFPEPTASDCKPPLHPDTMKSPKLACRFDMPCWCIACAGVHTKPCTASCMVCAAIIPYSVCNKIAVTTPPSTLPSICFFCCRCAFGES